ncbi:probable peroxygenase 5 [Miscanthus floridulus]|uniref:probable peroxygenase 5 n=1 Tax=Miscanthus floridulus TaxID=154761 RepID=UPI003458E1D3
MGMGRAPRRRASPALLLFAVLFVGRAAAFGDPQGAATTDLYKHASFFDRDGDGVVSFAETYGAFRALGFGLGMSGVSAAFINGALGSKCRPQNATSSKLDIYVEDIYKGKHGSDSGSYDAEGRFVPGKFEEIFAKHAKTVPDALTSDEIDQLLEANREPGDYSGWAGAEAEWKILYSLGKDKDGLLRKDVARSVYDGTLFHRLAPNWKSPDKERLSVIREN